MRPSTFARSPGKLLLLLAAAPALAQQSASFKLEESTLNEGGSPSGGAFPASASFAVSLDAIGGAVHLAGASSTSYNVDAGFAIAYSPPGETLNLTFTSKTTLAWSPEKSVGDYNVYRGLLSSLPGGYGACLASNVPGEAITDSATPPAGEGFFYLVTAENRIEEEGTKGLDSLGVERTNATPCP